MRIPLLPGCRFAAVAALVAGAFLGSATLTPAANYSWTNTMPNASGYWTNGVLWGQPGVTPYPGSAGSDAAYLTNHFAGTYTNILNAPLANPVSTLAISNTLGEAWLLITNTTLINATSGAFSLGSGGRLQIDNDGIFTQQANATFTWLGTNGAIYLNNGGKLFTSSAAKTYGTTGGSVTGLVTSTSGPGEGGVWNYGGAVLTIGGGSAHDNILRITDGAVITNMGALTINGNRNSLIASNGGKVFGAGAITFTTTSYGNTVNLGSGLWNLQANFLTVGGAAASSNNTFIGQLSNTAGNGIISVGSAFLGGVGGNNNTVTLTNSTLTTANSWTTYFGSGASNNVFTLSGGTVWDMNYTASPQPAPDLVIGNGQAVSNIMIVDGSMVKNLLAVHATPNALIIGNSSGSISNQLIIQNGGAVSNVDGVVVGGAQGANYNSLIVTNGGRFVMHAPGNNGDVLVGAGEAGGSYALTVGGNNNRIIVSNSLLITRNWFNVIGYGSSNNTVTLLADSIWNAGAFQATPVLIAGGSAGGVGALQASAGVSNGLTINGGVLSNASQVVVGNGAGNINNGNFMVVTNAGRLYVGSSGITIGMGGSASNTFKIDGGSSSGAFVTNAGVLNLGFTSSGYNSLTVSNARLFTGAATIGSGSSNNTATLLAGATWNLGANALTIGTGTATGNVLTVNGGRMTNVGTVIIGNSLGSVGNSLTLSNGSRFFSGAITIGNVAGASNNNYNVGGLGLSSTVSNGTLILGNANGAGFNTMTITNATLVTAGTYVYIGRYSVNNTVNILTNGVWDAGGKDYYIGVAFWSGAAASNNVVTVNGGLLTNVNTLLVGNAHSTYPSSFNSLVVTNGGAVKINTGLTISSNGGGVPTENGNAVVVTGTGSVLNVSGGTTIATVAGGSNRLTVANGGLAIISGGSGFLLGASTLSGTNLVLVTGSGSVLSNVGNFIVGNSGVGNQLVISNGARLSSTAVIVGGNANNNNSVLLNSGGVLEANTLTIGASTTGNTLSNRNATYQFTAAPAITSLTPGDIAITDGTISFRATNTASVATNAVNQINKIRFAGANTFMLNNASNTAVVAGVNQTYTFNAIPGNPSNYASLVMVNGSTAYGNANGANITIGLAGSMLVSSTTATVSGLVTNTGSLSFVNAYATFQSRVYNSGTNTMLNSVGTFNSGVVNAGHWLTDPTTNVFAGFGLTNTASGVISMAAGDVYVFTNTPGGATANFVNVSTNNVANDTLAGKFVFSGGLGLTQAFAVAGQNLGPPAVNAAGTATNAGATIVGFTNNFALGTLELSNFSTVRVTDAFINLTTAGLYLENLFLGQNSLLIIDTNVQVYFKNSNAWSLANIRLVNNQGGGDANDYNNAISGIHQLVIVPEPSVAVLYLAGFVTIWLSRRRYRRKEI